MARVKAIAVGYYNYRRIKVGQVFEMKGVDADGFYLDKAGKKAKFKDPRSGEEVERKCKWVANVKTELDLEVDPKEVAAVISGKNPGQKKEDFEELGDEPEVKPSKAK